MSRPKIAAASFTWTQPIEVGKVPDPGSSCEIADTRRDEFHLLFQRG